MFSGGEAVSTVERAGGRFWIRVAEPVRLRDYFLRLGTHAEIVAGDGEAVVIVESNDPDIEAYLETWTSINQTEASVTQTPAPPTPTTNQVLSSRPRLGDLLLAKGMISEPQLKEALSESHTRGELLGRILLRHQWIFEDELARVLAQQLNLPYMNLRHTGIDYSLATLIPLETGMRFATIPIGFHTDRIRVAFADPCDDQAHQAATAHIPHFDSVVAELTDIEQAWRTVAHRNPGL